MLRHPPLLRLLAPASWHLAPELGRLNDNRCLVRRVDSPRVGTSCRNSGV